MKSHLQHLGLYSDLYLARWLEVTWCILRYFWTVLSCGVSLFCSSSHTILVGCICEQHTCICMYEMYISFVASLTLPFLKALYPDYSHKRNILYIFSLLRLVFLMMVIIICPRFIRQEADITLTTYSRRS